MGKRAKNNQVLDGLKAFGLTYGLTKGVMSDSDMSAAAKIDQSESNSGAPAAIEYGNTAQSLNGDQYAQLSPDERQAAQDAYTGAADEALKSGKTQYTLGDETRETKFTRSEVGERRMNAMADVRAKYGDPEAAQRLRLQAIQTRGVERKQADDDELRRVLSSGTLSVANAARPRNEALRSSISTGADITGASSVLEHEPAIDGMSAPQSSPTAGQGQAAKAGNGPSLDNYLRTTAPNAMKVLLKQGRVQEAKQFSEFVDSEEGRSYATKWMNGVRKHAIGDSAGALADFEEMYNSQLYNDGHSVKMTPLEGGKKYQIDQINADGKVIGSQTGDTASLANQAASALSPMSAVKFHAEQQAARAKETALLDRQMQLEGLRQQGQEVREDRRDDRLAMRLEARGAGGGLTLPQQRSNSEIDAAREAVAGMDPAEIRRLTAKATATGRENPDYRPELDRAARLAGRRKVGNDDLFDQRQGGQKAEAPAVDRTDVANRFRSERGMDRHTLGRDLQTVEINGKPVTGYPVMDKSGRVIGIFN